jgi:hypothetical protein
VKRLPLFLLLGLQIACASGRTSSRFVGADLAFTHVNVVDVESGRVLPGHTVLIAGNRIQVVGPSASVHVPSGAQVVDGSGKYVIPGLVDTHVHAVPFTQVDIVALPLFRFLLANGVTTVREMGAVGRERSFVELRKRADRGEVVFPRFYVSGTVSPPNVARHDADDLRGLTRRLVDLGVDGLKVIGLARDEALGVVEAAKGAGVPVYGHTFIIGGAQARRPDLAFGHDNYTLEIVRAGLAGVVHIASASPTPAAMPPSPILKVTAESATEWYLDQVLARWLHATDAELQETIEVMIANGAWYEPTLVVADVDARPERYRGHPGERSSAQTVHEFRELPTYTDGDQARMAAVLERAKQFVLRFHRAGGMLVVGSDNAPLPGWGTHDEMRLLVEAGLSPLAALQAATVNAARALRWEDRIGTTKEGMLADLVLLDANPLEDIANTRKILAVVLNGRYLDRNALDELLARAERTGNGPNQVIRSGEAPQPDQQPSCCRASTSDPRATRTARLGAWRLTKR